MPFSAGRNILDAYHANQDGEFAIIVNKHEIFINRLPEEVFPLKAEITAYEQNKHFHFITTSGPIQAEDRFNLEPINDGTRLKLEIILADAEIAAQAKDQWDKSLKTLQELLEGGG
jgi:hypothetical protein